MFRQALLTAILLLAALTACGGTREPTAGSEEETAARLAFTSAAFQEGGDIPGRHTCDGLDLSPIVERAADPAHQDKAPLAAIAAELL